MKIKAIETRYAGCRFRSRLEARWAVFFDHLDIRWEYEPQGFKVGGEYGEPQRYYLPDFFLPAAGMWVEVKGSEDALDLELLIAASTPESGLPRDPEGTPYDDSTRNGRKLLILGPVPDVRIGFCAHWAISFHKGDYSQDQALFLGDTLRPVETLTQGRKFACDSGDRWDVKDPFTTAVVYPFLEPEPVRQAYIAARSARFEHGECG